MRLLWMKSDYIVPPDTGGKIRTYNLLRELHHLCDVTYLSFRPTDTQVIEPEMQQCASQVVTVPYAEEKKSGPFFCLRVLSGIPSRLPYILQKYRSSSIIQNQRRFVKATDQKTPVVLCDFLEMSENVDWSLPCPKILFQHNVESMIWERYYQNETNPWKKAYFNYERKRMARYESETCNRFDLVFTVSEEDKELLKSRFRVTRPIEVLETGVDTRFFAPREDVSIVPDKLLFLGSMDWMPNIDGMTWFCREVYPLIQAQRPGISLDIVGRRPGAAIYKFAEFDPTIRVIPDVPDVRPHIAACDLFVVPLRIGGGSRIKIYEAMAMNRPVVSTTIGAEGLPLREGRDIAIGDSPIEFADRVIGLLQDPRQKTAIANSGYRLVTENYQWKNVAQKLCNHCRQLAHRS